MGMGTLWIVLTTVVHQHFYVYVYVRHDSTVFYMNRYVCVMICMDVSQQDMSIILFISIYRNTQLGQDRTSNLNYYMTTGVISPKWREVRDTVVARWTAGQPVVQGTLHQGHDS